jgi:hypothetical protein
MQRIVNQLAQDLKYDHLLKDDNLISINLDEESSQEEAQGA